MIATGDSGLMERLIEFKQALAAAVLAKAERLEQGE